MKNHIRPSSLSGDRTQPANNRRGVRVSAGPTPMARRKDKESRRNTYHGEINETKDSYLTGGTEDSSNSDVKTSGSRIVRKSSHDVGTIGKNNGRSAQSPRQHVFRREKFSNAIQEEEDDEEQSKYRQKERALMGASGDEDKFEELETDGEDIDLVGALHGSKIKNAENRRENSLLITDLEEYITCSKDGEAQRGEQTNDSCSDSDSMYDTDLEEEFSPQRTQFHRTGKEIYELICKRKGIIPASFLLSRFSNTEVLMSHHGLGPEGAKAFAKALVSNKCIETLDVSDNDLKLVGGTAFAFMLHGNSYITDLDLSENAIGISAGIQVAKALLVNQTINRLILRGNQLTDKVAVAFAETLTENRSLRVLDLSYNELGESGGLYLGAGLSMNYGLVMLNLKWNAISGKGAVSIAHALMGNETLASLNVSWNSFGYTGALALSKNLKKNENLKHLDVRNNHLRENAIMKISSAIATHKSLVEIKLGQNPIGEPGIQAVFEAVFANPRIKYVGLEDISVPQKFIPKVLQLEEERQAIIITDKKSGLTSIEKENAAMDVLMAFLKENSLRLKDMFFRLDKDHSGDITRDEFKFGLKEMGILLDPRQLEKLINEIDKDNSNTIDYREIIEGHRTAKLEKRKQNKVKNNLIKKHEAALILPEMDLIKQKLSFKDL